MKNNQKPLITNQKKQQEIQTTDSGRSMVEMLGTLAVIGVLSITGIMGYKYAMNKYQVNKIANELNTLSQQIFLTMSSPHNGEFELSLGDLYDEGFITTAPYAFDFGCGNDIMVETPCTEDEPHYFLSLEAVPSEIRLPLAQLMKQLPNVTTAANNEEMLAFVYTRDDVTEDGNSVVSTSNDDISFPESTGIKPIDSASLSLETMSAIESITQSEVTTITTTITQECQIDAERECCTNDDCIKKYNSGYYCWTKSKHSTIEQVSYSKCKITDTISPKTDIDWKMSKESMNWWSAIRFCEAGRYSTMLSLQYLNCKSSELSHNGCYPYGTCYEASISDKNVKSNLVNELFEAYGDYKGWLSDACTEQSQYIWFDDAFLTASYRNDEYRHAVCQ